MLRLMRLGDEGGDEDCVCSEVLPPQAASGEQGSRGSSFSLFGVFYGGLERVAAESPAACDSLLQDSFMRYGVGTRVVK